MGIDIKTISLQQLLQQELTRKQFLQVLGMLIISVLGFNNILSLFTSYGRHTTINRGQADKSSNGFGSSRFGV